MNRIFRLQDTCLLKHAYVRATIVAFTYNRFVFKTILLAKGFNTNFYKVAITNQKTTDAFIKHICVCSSWVASSWDRVSSFSNLCFLHLWTILCGLLLIAKITSYCQLLHSVLTVFYNIHSLKKHILFLGYGSKVCCINSDSISWKYIAIL